MSVAPLPTRVRSTRRLGRVARGAAVPKEHASAFGAPFWYTYAANTAMMVAVSLLYRYADFVRGIGGDELQLGLIVGAGMVGSLAMRSMQGVGIDVYGARKMWIGSAALTVVCCLGHLLITTAYGPSIFILRIALQTGIAGFFGASISYVSARAPVANVVEIVATLGTSGFVGTILGTVMGDLLIGAGNDSIHLFMIAAAICGAALVFGWLATDGQTRPLQMRRRPPIAWLVRRYHPGPLLIMGVAAGFGLGIPTVYVRPFAEELGIDGMSWFFFPYMLVAFAARITMRRLPALIGMRPVVTVGAVTIALGMLSFNVVTTGWHMLVPAVFMGLAHAIMFPTVVAGGSTAFPPRYRGLGTTFMLAMFDLGNFIAFVSVGAMIVAAKHLGLPAYETMFVVVSILLAAAGVAYFVASRERVTA